MNAPRLRTSSGSFYIPDVTVVPSSNNRRAREERSLRLEVYEEPLPLVVEVWSTSTGDYDVEVKLQEYQRRGGAEIWRLHPYEHTLTAWRRQPDGSYTTANPTSRCWCRFGFQRQPHHKLCARSPRLFDRNRAGMALGDFAANIESNSDAADLLVRPVGNTVEPLKKTRHGCRGNSQTVVANGQQRPSIFAADCYLDGAAVRAVLHGVVQQVDDDLLDAVAVPMNLSPVHLALRCRCDPRRAHVSGAGRRRLQAGEDRRYSGVTAIRRTVRV